VLTVHRAGAEGLTTAVIAAVADIVCCAGLPLIAALLGGIALAALLGVAGGMLVVAALTAIVVAVMRKRGRRIAPRGTRSRLP
jgi:hypothetical protein